MSLAASAVHDSAAPAWPAADAVTAIIEAGRFVAARGWVPATSGNLSIRSAPDRIAITASGLDKGALEPRDVLTAVIDEPPPPGSSAETGLHLALYRRSPAIGAVVHLHAPNSTILSRRLAARGAVVLEGYELQKAFAGVRSHEVALTVPIFANSQDIAALADTVERGLGEAPVAPGYLLAGHGLYAWGATMREALRHAEAFEFLFGCEIAGGAA
jgi:methylthioribulose-1-phosphate dehydratase